MAGKWMVVAVSMVAVLAAHCGGGSKDPAVITLAGRSVPLSVIVRDYDRLNETNPWKVASPEERQKFVETYARKEVLLEKAREQCGPELHDRELRQYNRWLDQREYDSYYKTLLDATAFTQARRDSMHKVQSEQRLFAQIAAAREEDIRAIYARIQAGEDFSKVGREADASSDQISFYDNLAFSRAEMPLEMSEVLFAMDKPGQVSQPFRSARYGWHLLRYDGERTVDPTLDEKAEERAETGFRQSRQMREEQRIRDKYRFDLVTENVGVVQKRFSPFYDSLTGGNPKQFTVDFGVLRGPVWIFTPEELALPIVRWSGGTWTIRDYVNSLQPVHLFYWPGSGDEASVGHKIMRRMEQWAAIQEGTQKGMYTTPAFEADKERKRDELLLDCFYRESVQTYDFQVTRDEVHAYWDGRRDKYMSPDEVTYGFIYFPGELRQVATQAYQRLQAGEAWETVGAQMAKRDKRIVFEAMMTPQKEYSYPDVRNQAIKYDVKGDGSPQVIEPIEVQSDWLLLKIFTRNKPKVLEYEAAEEQAYRDLAGEKMEARLLSLLDEYGKAYQLQINQKAIQ